MPAGASGYFLINICRYEFTSYSNWSMFSRPVGMQTKMAGTLTLMIYGQMSIPSSGSMAIRVTNEMEVNIVLPDVP